jgi:hypothetical protein
VTFEDGNSRALLNSLACYELDGPDGNHTGYTFYEKTFGALPECEMGSGAEIIGSPYEEVNGIYVDCMPGDTGCVPGKTLVQLTDNAGRKGKGSKIVWHHSNCGWAVKRDISAPAPAPAPSSPTCVDNDAAAAFAFMMPADSGSICSIAGGWTSSYCGHPLFYALCAATCGCADVQAAAVKEYASLIGESFTCEESECDDPIEAVLCSKSCPKAGGRRLTEAKLGGKLGGKFRRAMANLALEQAHAAERRLGVEDDGDYEEVYNTFGIPGSTNAMCGTMQTSVSGSPISSSAAPSSWHYTQLSSKLYSSGIFYDLALWHKPVDGTMSLSCPGGDMTYETAYLDPNLPSMHGNMYCALNNIAVMYNDDPEIVRNGCYQKCGPRFGSFNSTDNEVIDGKNTYCAGYGKDFLPHTNALCLPREECERLCTKHEECHSIDMHRVLPQCYLNTFACADTNNWEMSPEWDILTKIVTPTEATDITNDALRDTYETLTGFGDGPDAAPWDPHDPPIHARRRGIAYTEISKPRWACEYNCSFSGFRSMRDWCEGFVFESRCTVKKDQMGVDVFDKTKVGCPDEGTCKYFGAGFVEDDMTPMNYTFETEIPGSGSFYNLGIMESTVLRKKFKPCVVTVDDAGEDYDGEYSKFECAGATVFQNMDNSKRIKYRTDLECDGWVMEANTATPTPVDVFQCTDDAVAAKIFVGSLDDRYPEDSGHKYICETLYDEGACSFTETVRTKFLGLEKTYDTPLVQNQFTAVIRGLCSHTCLSIEERVIGGKVYYDQTLNTSVGTHFEGDPPIPVNIGSPPSFPIPGGAKRHESTCSGDDNVGAEAFLRLMSGLESIPDIATIDANYGLNYCGWFSRDPEYYNYTHSPCHWHPWARVWASLCVDTCKNTTAPYPPIIPDVPTDEVHVQGAQYPHRQLAGHGPAADDVDRGPTTQTGTYLDACAGWTPEAALLTWANGSSDLAKIQGGNCTNLAFGEAAYARLAFPLYETEPFIDPNVMVERKCESAAPCPELTTCVLAPMRFDKALTAKYYGIERGKPISSYTTEMHNFLLNFIPQVLVTDTRVEAHIAAAKFELTGKLNRNVPGSTELMFHPEINREQFGDFTVVSMAPSLALEDMVYARTEFQRTYAVPTGFSDWVTDVIRIERFSLDEKTGSYKVFCDPSEKKDDDKDDDKRRRLDGHGCYPGCATCDGPNEMDCMSCEDGSPIQDDDDGDGYGRCPGGGDGKEEDFDCGEFEFMLYAGVEELYMFGFPAGSKEAVPLGRAEPAYDAPMPGVFSFKIQAKDWFFMDIVGAEDLDECASSPCDPNAYCYNNPGGTPKTAQCECKYGYVGDGLVCALEQHSYTPTEQDYYLRIYHTDAIKYGWRVKDIYMYLDEECTDELPFNQGSLPYPPPPGCDMYEYPPSPACDKTYMDITSSTNVFTGVYAKSHYPGEYWNQYWNGNLFDRNPYTSWWSSSLELNPELKDGDAVTIEWLVNGKFDVKCVMIEQEEYHAASKLVLERGPVAEMHMGEHQYGYMHMKEGSPCLMEQAMKYMDHSKPRCKPTVTAVAMFDENPLNVKGFFKFQCGEPGKQIFGEILQLPKTTAAGWYGSYANDVEVISPCHCQALCIAHLSEGCRNYKYYDNHGIKHCYLQSSTFGPGEGYYGVDSSSDMHVADGWTSGYIGRIMTGFKTTMEAPGVAFNLTVTGVGLPFAPVASKSGAPRQRIKILPEAAECKAPIPPEVQGIGCTKSSYKIDTHEGPIVEDIYTVCSAKPVDASPDHAEFTGLKITPKPMETVYKVCYCAGNCYHPTTYEVLPGTITVPGSSYLFSTEPSPVYRKVVSPNGLMPITVKVERPLFGGDAVAAGWELKLIRAYKGCGVEPEESKVVPSGSKLADGSGYLGTVLNPDTVIWDFTLDFEAEDAGDWAVCFREHAGMPLALIPSKMGKYLSVLPVQPDIEHTTGIFHNSRFSALAGNAGTISVKGFRLPVPTDSMVALSTGSTCGDLKSFDAVPLSPPPSDDVVPPTLVQVYPIDSDTKRKKGVGLHQALTFTFSEPVTTDGCLGHLAIIPLQWNDTSTWTYVACEKLVTIGTDAVLLPKEFMFTGGEYFFRLPRGLLTDMAGNPLPFTSTETMYEVTADANHTGKDMTPEIVMTTPCNECESPVDVLTVEFSEPVSPVVGKLVTIIDCGADLTCTDTDYPIDYFDVTSLKVTMVGATGFASLGYNESTSATASFSIANLAMYRKYKVIIPALSFFDTDTPGGVLATAMPATPYEIIFTRVPDVKPVLHTVAASKTEKDSYTFPIRLLPGIPQVELSVCYCDANLDTTLEDLNDDKYTFKLSDDTKCSGMAPPSTEVPSWPVKKAIDSHICGAKCDAGCTGPMCFCDGNDGTATSTTLCLPPTLCREACEALGAACDGITVADGKPQCELLAPSTSCSEAEDWQSFKKHLGTACTHVEDFSERAGALAVTKRAMGSSTTFSSPERISRWRSRRRPPTERSRCSRTASWSSTARASAGSRARPRPRPWLPSRTRPPPGARPRRYCTTRASPSRVAERSSSASATLRAWAVKPAMGRRTSRLKSAPCTPPGLAASSRSRSFRKRSACRMAWHGATAAKAPASGATKIRTHPFLTSLLDDSRKSRAQRSHCSSVGAF